MDSVENWFRRAVQAGVGASIVAAAACTETAEGPVDPSGLSTVLTPAEARGTAPVAEKEFVCHSSGTRSTILEVGARAVAAHLSHGDYVTTLRISDAPDAGDDGIRFRRIGDALEAARTGRLARGELLSAACRITIEMPAGIYPGSAAPSSPEGEHFPLVVDVPDITLRGAFVMQVDANGRAAGGVPGAGESVLSPMEPLPFTGGVSTPLIIANAHPGGSAGHGLTVEGLVFRSGHAGSSIGGQGILALRVNGLLIRGNRFDGGFTEAIDLRAANGDVLLNQLEGPGGSCDICLSAPGRYQASSNVLSVGGIPGITVSGMVGLPVPPGIEPLALMPTAEIHAELRNNEVRDHLRTPVGVGLRVEAQGNSAPGVRNTIRAVIQDNLLVKNRFGIIVHGGFTGPIGGASALSSDVDVVLGGNTFRDICQARLFVTLARHQRTLGLNPFPSLIDSTFRLQLAGDLSWNDAWFGHEAEFGNTLIVDDTAVTNGIRHFYDATGCPGH